jgi:hypothetical protein
MLNGSDDRRGEPLVSTEKSIGVVQRSRGPLDPASPHPLSEPAIVARPARATSGNRTTVDWEAMAVDCPAPSFPRKREPIGIARDALLGR